MILRSRICSNFTALGLLVGATLMAGNSLDAGAVSGAVRLTGSRESSVSKHEDFSGVVVWLQPPSKPIERTPPPHERMIQKDKRFDPHVLAIEVGTTVDFPNLDPIFHNAFSSFDGQIFDLALYPPGTSRSIHFTHTGVARIFCNIHPSMSALIVVLDSPYFATTDKSGHFTIPNVPPGVYRLHVLHERATAETLAALTRSLTVPESGAALPLISISEAGYLPVAHKNKYGRDYPPVTDDHSGYHP
jgi:Polysaccharide lyase family 4, domain II